jgi:hypothetical protein
VDEADQRLGKPENPIEVLTPKVEVKVQVKL